VKAVSSPQDLTQRKQELKKGLTAKILAKKGAPTCLTKAR
jgi:hypothetical protein